MQWSPSLPISRLGMAGVLPVGCLRAASVRVHVRTGYIPVYWSLPFRVYYPQTLRDPPGEPRCGDLPFMDLGHAIVTEPRPLYIPKQAMIQYLVSVARARTQTQILASVSALPFHLPPRRSPRSHVVSFLPTVHAYMQYYKSFVPTRVLQAHPPPRAATRLSRTRCACLRSPPVISHANSRTASAPADLKYAPRRAVHTSTAPPTNDDSCHAPKHPRASTARHTPLTHRLTPFLNPGLSGQARAIRHIIQVRTGAYQ